MLHNLPVVGSSPRSRKIPMMSDSQPDSSPETSSTDAAPETEESGAAEVAPKAAAGAPYRPSYVFLALVSVGVLALDLITKGWAVKTLSGRSPNDPLILIQDVLAFSLTYNKGGAFGMLASETGFWRQPFFVLVSAGAVLFIVSLYKKLTPEQRALRFGLPLVLGGALGNLADRIVRSRVVDFIDYQAGWVQVMNELIAKLNPSWNVTNHWPTFNVADVAICTGIGLMALDMFMQNKAANSSNASTDDSKVPAVKSAKS
jgi:signal peptidase II